MFSPRCAQARRVRAVCNRSAAPSFWMVIGLIESIFNPGRYPTEPNGWASDPRPHVKHRSAGGAHIAETTEQHDEHRRHHQVSHQHPQQIADAAGSQRVQPDPAKPRTAARAPARRSARRGGSRSGGRAVTGHVGAQCRVAMPNSFRLLQEEMEITSMALLPDRP